MLKLSVVVIFVVIGIGLYRTWRGRTAD